MKVAVVFLFTAAAMLVAPARAHGQTQVIYSFAGDEDGEYADTDLVIDSSGNLYGSTVQGGDFGSGTVFELSPSATGWTHSVLYSFTGGADGGEPYKGSHWGRIAIFSAPRAWADFIQDRVSTPDAA